MKDNKVSYFIVWFLVCFVSVESIRRGCGNGHNECDIGNWQAWERCNSSCGGGYQTRRKPICCNVNEVKTLDQCIARCNLTRDEFISATTEIKKCGMSCYNKGKFNTTSFLCECINGTWGSCCRGRKIFVMTRFAYYVTVLELNGNKYFSNVMNSWTIKSICSKLFSIQLTCCDFSQFCRLCVIEIIWICTYYTKIFCGSEGRTFVMF